MKYIHTTAETLEHLRKQAKKRQSKQGGQMSDLLNTAAKEAKYQNWSHAQECYAAGERYGRTPLTEECFVLERHTLDGQDYVTATGFETAEPSAFLLFNNDRGDAWLYDVFSGQALCILLHRKPCELTPIRYQERRFDIPWDGEIDRSVAIPSLEPATDAARAKLGSIYIFPEYVALMLDDLGSQAERQAREFHQQLKFETDGQKPV